MKRQRILEGWARGVAAHQRTVLICAVVVTALSLLAMRRLEIRAGRVDLLGEHDPVAKAWLDFAHDFGSPNGIVLMIGGGTPADQRRAVDIIQARLEPHRRDLYRTLISRIDPDYLERYGAYYADTTDLQGACQLLELFQADSQPTWSGVFHRQEEAISRALRRRGGDADSGTDLASLAALTEEWSRSIESGSAPDLRRLEADEPLPTMTRGEVRVDEAGYLISNNGARHLFLIDPLAEREDVAGFLVPFMETINSAVVAAKADVPGTQVLMAGMSAYAFGELHVMQRELPWLTLLGLVGVLLIFRVVFGSTRPALYAGAALLLAALWTLGLTALTIGHLTLLSSVFGLILIGLGIDYGIHLLSRYQEERLTTEPVEAMAAVYRNGVNGILTGGLTTAAAFALCAFSEFAAFRELGLITAMGIGSSLLSMLTVLPALILRREAQALERGIAPFAGMHTTSRLDRAFARWGEWLVRYPVVGVAAGLAAIVFAVPRWSHVPFDHNFLHMQPADSPFPRAEEILATTTPLSPQFDIVLADSPQEAAAQVERLATLPTVRHVTYAGRLLPQSAVARQPLVQRLHTLADNAAVPDVLSNADVQDVTKTLDRMRARFSAYSRTTFTLTDKRAAASLQRIAHALDHLATVHAELSNAEWITRQRAFLQGIGAFVAERIGDARGVAPEPPTIGDLPADIRARYQGASGRLALYVIPSGSVWDRDFLLQFNTDVGSVSAAFTGMGALLEHLIGQAAAAPKQVALLVAVAVLALLILDFQHVGAVVAASASLALGIMSTFGLMHLLGLKFNPMNVLALPLLLGIGIDNSVHVLHRARTGPDASMASALRSAGKAIFIASATTVVSFGLLAFSTHRGIRGFGVVMALGVTVCYAVAIVVLPSAWELAARLGRCLEPSYDGPRA